MGTAGPIGSAKDHLVIDNKDGLFFVINSDIVCQYDLKQMLEKHREHKGLATLCVKEVEDPSKFGVVVADERGQVSMYKQTPTEFLASTVNCGIFIFNLEIFDKDKIKPVPSQLETDVLPRLANEGNLYCVQLDGFWMDIGLPHNYLLGTQLFLQYLQDMQQNNQGGPTYKIFDGEKSKYQELSEGNNIIGNVIIHPSAQVDPGAVLGPDVVIGKDCKIGGGARISNSTILSQTEVKRHAFIRNSIIGW